MSDKLLLKVIADRLIAEFMEPNIVDHPMEIMNYPANLARATKIGKWILAKVQEGLKKQIDIKRDYAFGESLFGSLEHQAQMQAKVDTYDTCLKLIKDIGGKE